MPGISYDPISPFVASRSSPSARYRTTLRSTRSRSPNASSAPAEQNASRVGSIPCKFVSNTMILPGGKYSGTTTSAKGPSSSSPCGTTIGDVSTKRPFMPRRVSLSLRLS